MLRTVQIQSLKLLILLHRGNDVLWRQYCSSCLTLTSLSSRPTTRLPPCTRPVDQSAAIKALSSQHLTTAL